ncbi:hypothetical protein MRX96_000768 [Rhipicephalus microplus]
MPARVLKCLGEDSREQLAEILTAIIEGEPIPKEWHEGKMEAATMGGGRYAVAATKRRLTEWWATIRRT